MARAKKESAARTLPPRGLIEPPGALVAIMRSVRERAASHFVPRHRLRPRSDGLRLGLTRTDKHRSSSRNQRGSPLVSAVGARLLFAPSSNAAGLPQTAVWPVHVWLWAGRYSAVAVGISSIHSDTLVFRESRLLRFWG